MRRRNALPVFLLFLHLTCGSALAQTSLRKVAVTLDDLPETGDLAPGQTRLTVAKAIIQALKNAGAPKVYGFVNAETLVSEPWLIKVLQAWRAAGFLLGNHTYSHVEPNTHSVQSYERNIALDEPVLKTLMAGEEWHWFRFPFLYEGPTLERRNALRKYLDDNHYRVAQVTIDFQDYLWNEPYARCSARRNNQAIGELEAMYLAHASEAIRMARARSISLYGRDIAHVLLLHDGAIEAVMLPKLLSLLKQDGFVLVTLDEAQRDPAYAIDPGVATRYGGTLLEQSMFARGLKDGPTIASPEKKLASLCRQPRS